MLLHKTFVYIDLAHEFQGGWNWKNPDLGKDIGSARAAGNIHSLSLDGPAVKDPENKGFLKRV